MELICNVVERMLALDENSPWGSTILGVTGGAFVLFVQSVVANEWPRHGLGHHCQALFTASPVGPAEVASEGPGRSWWQKWHTVWIGHVGQSSGSVDSRLLSSPEGEATVKCVLPGAALWVPEWRL